MIPEVPIVWSILSLVSSFVIVVVAFIHKFNFHLKYKWIWGLHNIFSILFCLSLCSLLNKKGNKHDNH